MKIHKVGTVTLGATFVVAGILFLAQAVFSLITYDIISKIWPIIFIVLGIEILIADRQAGETVCTYDKTAIILLFFLTLFLIFLAFLGSIAANSGGHFNFIY